MAVRTLQHQASQNRKLGQTWGPLFAESEPYDIIAEASGWSWIYEPKKNAFHRKSTYAACHKDRLESRFN